MFDRSIAYYHKHSSYTLFNSREIFSYRFSTVALRNSQCDCERGKSRIIQTFKVSEHLTILLCERCGKEIARWEDKIKPFKRKWLLVEQEAMR
jgi:hypothetical protein